MVTAFAASAASGGFGSAACGSTCSEDEAWVVTGKRCNKYEAPQIAATAKIIHENSFFTATYSEIKLSPQQPLRLARNANKSLLRFAVFSLVVQLNLAARSLLWRIDHAGIEGPRVNMQAHRPLVEFPRIEHAMHGIVRINRAGMRQIHLDRIGRFQ